MSLVAHFKISVRELVLFVFSCPDHQIRTRAGLFFTSKPNDIEIFTPDTVINLWYNNFNHKTRLNACFTRLAGDIILEESTQGIRDPKLKLSASECTIAAIHKHLIPQELMRHMQTLMPTTFNLLLRFATEPNPYRARKQNQTLGLDAGATAEEELDEDELDLESNFAEAKTLTRPIGGKTSRSLVATRTWYAHPLV